MVCIGIYPAPVWTNYASLLFQELFHQLFQLNGVIQRVGTGLFILHQLLQSSSTASSDKRHQELVTALSALGLSGGVCSRLAKHKHCMHDLEQPAQRLVRRRR